MKEAMEMTCLFSEVRDRSITLFLRSTLSHAIAVACIRMARTGSRHLAGYFSGKRPCGSVRASIRSAFPLSINLVHPEERTLRICNYGKRTGFLKMLVNIINLHLIKDMRMINLLCISV